MDFFVWSGLYSFIANLAIGIFVYTRNPRKSVNILYALFSLTVSGWSFGSFLENVIPDKSLALFVLRCNYLFAVWLPPLYVHFVYALTGVSSKANRRKLQAGYLFSLLFSPIVFTPWFIERLRTIEGTSFYISTPGSLYYVFFGFFTIGVGEVLFHTLSRLRKSSGRRRTQFKYITVANAIAIFAGFEYFSRVFGFFNTPPWDDYILVVYLSIVAYAIVRHHLMDIEVIIKKTLVFTGLFGMVMAIVAAVTTLTQNYLSRYFSITPMVSTMISVVLAIFLYDPTRKFLVNATDRYLFQKKEDFRKVLNRLSSQIITILDLDRVGKTILSTLENSLRLESGAIFILDENESRYRVLDSFGLDASLGEILKDDPLIQFFLKEKRPINYEDPHQIETLSQNIKERLGDLRARECLPLFFSGELNGFLVLGRKKSDQEFKQDELDYFPTVASQAAIALSNARSIAIQRRSQIEFAQQSKMAAIGTLSTGISHEVKNPLQIIKSAVGFLRLNRKLGAYKDMIKEAFEEVVFETLDRIEASVDRANGVIERLSGFSKKPKELKVEPVSLERAAEEVLGLITSEFEKSSVTVKKNYAPKLPLIMADLHAIEQILLNLLVNAGHAIKEKGGESGTITIQTQSDPQEVEISVKDTGSGISPQNLEKIFDPFFTTKDTSRNTDTETIKGTGLGLFLVREMIKQYGGRIKVESQLGIGTTFRVFFPMPSRTK